MVIVVVYRKTEGERNTKKRGKRENRRSEGFGVREGTIRAKEERLPLTLHLCTGVCRSSSKVVRSGHSWNDPRVPFLEKRVSLIF